MVDKLQILVYVIKTLWWGLTAALVLWAIPSIIFSLAEEYVNLRKQRSYAPKHQRSRTPIEEVRMRLLLAARV